MAGKPRIRRLVDDRDAQGLVQALRYPQDPEIRAQAAQGLGKLGKVKTVESLIRSFLQDPDPDARQAALDALHQIIGGEADLAISVYTLPEDIWIDEKTAAPEQKETQEVEAVAEPGPAGEDEDDADDQDDDWDEDDLEEDEEQDQEGGEGENIWTEDDIQALLSVIRVDYNRKKRLKAIRALSQIPNTRAIDALASIALWSEEKWLREAAREALAGIYGDSLDEVLQSYRDSSQEELADEAEDDTEEDDEEGAEDDDYDDEDEDEDDDEEDEDGDEEEDGAGEAQENHYLPLNSPAATSPVIQEEKPGWGTYVLIGLLILVILGGIVYLLVR